MIDRTVPARLEVRLDEARRRKLAQMLGDGRGRASEIARWAIDLAYEEHMRQRRREAVRRIAGARVEDVPDPDELSPQLGDRYAAALPPEDGYAEP